MPRIAKADVHAALQRAADHILDAARPDGRVSRRDIKDKVQTLGGTERALVDIFYKFIDHRDAAPGAQVTKKDIDRAVAYANEKLVDKYDLNSNGLSKDEISRMSTTGQLAVRLARELKAAAGAQPPADTTVDAAADEPKADQWGYIDLASVGNDASLRYLNHRFPGIDFDRMHEEAEEVVDNREGVLNEPLRFAYLHQRDDGTHLVSIQGEFDYEGSEFSFYADFIISDGDYSFYDAGAD